MIYLDHAATTFPKPEQVYQKADACMREYLVNPGRSAHQLAMRANREIYAVREQISRLFSVGNPEQVIFTSNATEALNLAIKGLLRPGDHVVSTVLEHNSVLRPIRALEKTGVESTLVGCTPHGGIDPLIIEQAIRPNTKLVAMTHASNLIGTVTNIAEVGEICRRHGVLFLVDAAQTAGILPIDMKAMHIDLLAAPGHKSLFGLPGTGFLAIGDGVSLRPLKEGGTGSFSESLDQPSASPDQYESGTLNLPGIVSLGAGLSFLEEVGLKAVRKKEELLVSVLTEGFLRCPNVTVYGAMEPGKRAAVVSINVGVLGSSEVAYRLDQEYGIATRSGLHCAPLAHEALGTTRQGAVRFSVSALTTEEEVAQAVLAIRAISEGTK